MPQPPSQDALARRALIEDIKEHRKGWLQHGLAALGVSLLGLGVAGSMVGTSNAGHTEVVAPAAQVSAQPAADVPAAFDREAPTTSRDVVRPALDQARLKSLADQRAEELSKTDDEIEQAARTKAAAARDKSLVSTSESTQKRGTLLAEARVRAKAEAAARALAARSTPRAAPRSPATRSSTPAAPQAAPKTTPSAPVNASGKSCMPIRGGYSIAARFGQVGSWSRYHTGFDFSAPVGTTLQAPASGVVTNAGSGPASGWAGNYVVIRYPDGTSSLSAHMSTVSVSVGQAVGACQVVGAVGMTGRTFGPHVHFEIYSPGVRPGDVYQAANPLPWLNAHGIKP